MELPMNCPQCHLGYVEMFHSCANCGYPQKESIILHKVENIERMLKQHLVDFHREG